MRRRGFLVSAAALLAGSCAPVRQAPILPTPAPVPIGDQQAWAQEAASILQLSLGTLRTFDDFATFRLGQAIETSRRAMFEPAWDPPTSDTWNATTAATSEVANRARDLFTTVSQSRVDEGQWRERRRLAQGAHALADHADAMIAYRVRTDSLAPRGDGTGAWSLWDNCWATWNAAAAFWDVRRTVAVPCS